MKLDRFQEQIFFSTVRITIPSKSGSGASIGTGFILRTHLNDTKNRYVLLLISNRHVYGDTSQSIILNFHKKKADGSIPELGQIVTLKKRQFKGIYIGHPDPDVDLACINISIITYPQHNIFYKSLNTKMFSDFSEDNLLPGADVWFIGYPENRFDIKHNLPILRRGYIASIPKVDFNDKHQFVIDAQVFQGSSGSPVFSPIGSYFKFVGVVTETMIRNEKLQAVPTTIAFGVQQILGLGIVIKAPVVNELIDHATNEIKLLLEKEEGEPVTKESDKNDNL
jgi:hypothetical protein